MVKGAASSPGAPAGALPRKRRQQSRVACNACRSRKMKCDAARPCSRCVSRQMTCEYATLDDSETRTQAMRRENDALRMEIQLLRRRVSRSPSSTSHAETSSLPLLPISPSNSDKHRGGHDGPKAGPPADYIPSKPVDPGEPHMPVVRAPAGNFETSGRALLDALANRSFEQSFPLLCSLRNGNRWDTILEALATEEALPQDEGACSDSVQPTDATSDSLGNDLVPKNHPSAFKQPVWDALSMQAFSSPGGYASSSTLQLWLDSSPWLPLLFDRQSFSQANVVQSFVVAPSENPSTTHDPQQTWVLSSSGQALLSSGTNPPHDPFWNVVQELRAHVRDGVCVEDTCGSHVYAAALDDEAVYRRAPKLSQLMARLVKSIKPFESPATITMYALMWAYWTLFRWTLAPSSATLEEIPEILRPSSWRISAPRIFMVDFVLFSALRDYLCMTQSTDMRWCTAAWTTIVCHWAHCPTQFLWLDERTGELDLSPYCKFRVGLLDSWSLGPSVRSYLPNIDDFFTIRSHDDVRTL